MRIWGMSYGLVGDLIMGLPMLRYFEKKYPSSYKFWVIEKKCSFVASIYLNHPLIDRIKITDEWSGFGLVDKLLMDGCDIVTRASSKHDPIDWYNYRSCIEETAILAGIPDLFEVLLADWERRPALNLWFDVGFDDPNAHTYSKDRDVDLSIFKRNVAIWPFATANSNGRSPSVDWWNNLIRKLLDLRYTVFHYGREVEPRLNDWSGYRYLTHLSYFDQVRAALASNLVIGTDSGSQWVMGAYSHPAINLITNWMKNHHTNFMALNPVNPNAKTFFAEYGCDNIAVDDVVEHVRKEVP